MSGVQLGQELLGVYIQPNLIKNTALEFANSFKVNMLAGNLEFLTRSQLKVLKNLFQIDKIDDHVYNLDLNQHFFSAIILLLLYLEEYEECTNFIVSKKFPSLPEITCWRKDRWISSLVWKNLPSNEDETLKTMSALLKCGYQCCHGNDLESVDGEVLVKMIDSLPSKLMCRTMLRVMSFLAEKPALLDAFIHIYSSRPHFNLSPNPLYLLILFVNMKSGFKYMSHYLRFDCVMAREAASMLITLYGYSVTAFKSMVPVLFETDTMSVENYYLLCYYMVMSGEYANSKGSTLNKFTALKVESTQDSLIHVTKFDEYALVEKLHILFDFLKKSKAPVCVYGGAYMWLLNTLINKPDKTSEGMKLETAKTSYKLWDDEGISDLNGFMLVCYERIACNDLDNPILLTMISLAIRSVPGIPYCDLWLIKLLNDLKQLNESKKLGGFAAKFALLSEEDKYPWYQY